MTKIYQKEGIITEKFALLNLLQALGGLTATGGATDKSEADETAEAPSAPAPAPSAPPEEQKPNFMAEILTRHERISNRVSSKK